MSTSTMHRTMFEAQPLQYSYSSLEPYISQETLEFHHGKHYTAYLTKLNELCAADPNDTYRGMNLEQVVESSQGAIFNNASQVLNHELYFEQFSPNPTNIPSDELLKAIDARFGSMDGLREAMNVAAMGLFGSGWCYLSLDGDNQMHISARSNALSPVSDGESILLLIDLWEHAYYIDHRNRRADSLECFWKVLDWQVVESRY